MSERFGKGREGDMQNDLMFRRPSISTFLIDTEIGHAVRVHCVRLAESKLLLLRMSAIGKLLDPELPVEDVWQLQTIHDRIGRWLELMSRDLIYEIEDLAQDELARQIKNLRDADVSTFDNVKLLEINAQRDLLEDANRLLLRAKRPYVERRLNELNKLIPSRP